MKKIGLIVKETSEKRIKDNLKDSSSIFILKYSKVSAPDFTTLRHSLKNTQSSLLVVNNTVARRALKESGLEEMLKNVEGPCGLVFIKDDPAQAASALYKFSKDHEQLQVEAGLLKDKLIEKKDIERLAKLPPRQVLLTQIAISLNSPVSKLAVVLNQTLRKFIYCLDQVKNKKVS